MNLFDNESYLINENEASESDKNQKLSENIESTWKTIIQHWIDLVNEEEISDDIDQDNYDITFNILTPKSIHLAHD